MSKRTLAYLAAIVATASLPFALLLCGPAGCTDAQAAREYGGLYERVSAGWQSLAVVLGVGADADGKTITNIGGLTGQSAGMAISNVDTVSTIVTALGTLNTTVAINLDTSEVQTVTIDDTTAFSASGYAASTAKTVTLLITASGGNRTVTFDGDWKWLGLKPSTIASGATGMLSILSTSNAATGVVAAYELLGTGA